ncbi:MAG TPA: hypothetical protein VM784_05750 [Actinomycetota bacterium]|nr:hypothetical protein [Actinomycetota bacterium]HWI03359.1 hypothetical protein [Acidimicrobiales bacterium]
MSVWADQHVENRILEILGDVREGVEGHHFGRPFITAYQLAIALDRRYPQIREALGEELGGEGIGQRNSYAQYIARELSQRISAVPDYPVEGRMLSNADVLAIDYRGPHGEPVRSSLTGSGYDLSMYRLREAAG